MVPAPEEPLGRPRQIRKLFRRDTSSLMLSHLPLRCNVSGRHYSQTWCNSGAWYDVSRHSSGVRFNMTTHISQELLFTHNPVLFASFRKEQYRGLFFSRGTCPWTSPRAGVMMISQSQILFRRTRWRPCLLVSGTLLSFLSEVRKKRK